MIWGIVRESAVFTTPVHMTGVQRAMRDTVKQTLMFTSHAERYYRAGRVAREENALWEQAEERNRH